MLSGTGSDGTRGLKAIKEYGGIAVAQTLESARYDAIANRAPPGCGRCRSKVSDITWRSWKHPEEADQLFNDLLIGVTQFPQMSADGWN